MSDSSKSEPNKPKPSGHAPNPFISVNSKTWEQGSATEKKEIPDSVAHTISGSPSGSSPSGTSFARSLKEVKQVGNYFITKTLGEGAFSKVKLGIHCKTEEQVAIKIMKKERLIEEGLIEQVKREISIMKLIKHPNIVQLYEVMSSKTNLYLVMELITGGEIFWKVAAENKFTEDVARKYFKQLISGVEYCHAHGVYHRDLKPENLLIDSKGNLKIADFGLSAQIRSDDDKEGQKRGVFNRKKKADDKFHTKCGTPQYVAPEVFNAEGYYGGPVDIWACGVVLFVFLTGRLPFDDPNQTELFRRLLSGSVDYPDTLSFQAKNFLQKIFVVNPVDRITIRDIKLHPWFIKDSEDEQQVQVDTVDVSNLPEDSPKEDLVPTSIEGDLASMNAFDLINKAGMLNLTRLLRDTSMDHSKLANTYFTTSEYGSVVMERICAIFDGMLYFCFCIDRAEFSMRVTGRSTTKGVLVFDVKISQITATLRIVDFSRRRGPILEFYKIFKEVENQCADIIVR